MKNNLKKSQLLISTELGIYSNLYKDIYFDKVSSIFYFDNDLNFVGSIWDNIYKLNDTYR